MLNKYETNKHSVFLLQYHLILVTKYRKQVLDDIITSRILEIFNKIASGSRYQLKIIEANSDNDHLHIIFSAQPKSEISKFLNAFKSSSSRLIQKEFPEIKTKLWNNQFWSKSFFLATTGGVTLETLKQYVENQGKNNR